MKASRSACLSLLAAVGALVLSVDATPDGIALSVGREARADLCACNGPLPCECGDTCSWLCPQPVWPDDQAYVPALLSELDSYASLLWPIVATDNWEILFETAWAQVKGAYPASLAARGITANAATEEAFKEALKQDLAVREKMTEIFDVAATEMILTSSAAELDDDHDEECPDTAPKGWNAQNPPPGYWIVPSTLADTATKPYQLGGWGMVYVPGATGYDMGRLQQEYRDAAKAGNAFADLFASALAFRSCQTERGNAYADLAVTGRRSFASFGGIAGSPAVLRSSLVSALLPLLPFFPPPENCSVPLATAVNMAVARAYHVGNVIRVGTRLGTGQASYRAQFGYIAVSGEDDPPYRPVNVPSAPFRQNDLDVAVPLRHEKPLPLLPQPTVTVNTRYFIAETQAMQVNANLLEVLPSDPPPLLSSDAEVILYVHGLDSRAEEALELTSALHDVAMKNGKNYAVIAMDLPTSGYASKIDHLDISPLSAVGYTKTTCVFGGFCVPDFDTNGLHNVPALDFVEDFIVSFVDTLDASNPSLELKAKIKAVVGGSLGGNMGLRLGRRTDLPWLRRVVAWSPASVWDSLADGADITKHVGVRVPWERSGEDETDGSRWEFFDQNFYKKATEPLPIIDEPLPHTWYRKDWPCIHGAILGVQLDRQETYHRNFRTWHWRLAAEQLVYSHTWEPSDGSHPYEHNHIPLLLLAGAADDYPYAGIYSATADMAQKMKWTPGALLLLGDQDHESTGHSIHDERPHLLAARMEHFFSHPYAF